MQTWYFIIVGNFWINGAYLNWFSNLFLFDKPLQKKMNQIN